MARKRMIDPGFWTDEKLGSVPPLARLLFMGLISNSDDEGILPGHPALIKSQIFPYDIEVTVSMVTEWLDLLSDLNIIIAYTVDNQTYIQVKNFLKHQTINKAQKSKYPKPEITGNEGSQDNYGSTTAPLREDYRLKEEKRREENIREEKRKSESDTTYSDDSIPITLSKLLFSLKAEHIPKAKEPNYQKWAEHIDKMHRIDGITFEEIEELIRWCQQDSFWKSNILSTQKLREKYEQLYAAKERDKKNSKSDFDKKLERLMSFE